MKVKRKAKEPRTEFRILVCGSRDWTDRDRIAKELVKLIKEQEVPVDDVLVITGGADGADSMVEDICKKELGIACAVFPAPWDAMRKILGNHKAAGPIRNGWMLRWGQPDYILAFHPYIVNSKGTKNMVEQNRKRGIDAVPVRIIEK